MNKKEIEKIKSFITEVSGLPNELLTADDTLGFRVESSRQSLLEKRTRFLEKVNDIKIRLSAYFRAVAGENSSYIGLLQEITFMPKQNTYNTIHYKNNEAWLNDKTKLLDLLKMAKTEFEEKNRIAIQNPENSIKHYLKSKEAKGIILGALLALITGLLTKDIWWDKVFSHSSPTIEKVAKAPSDSAIWSDKKHVIYKATEEVFSNYLQTIQTLKSNYAPISALGYIEDYLKKEILNIESRIANKSYIHRFATNERNWTNTDFLDVANLIRVRTINRIKEISEDVETKAQGAFIVSDDKLRLREEEVQAEVAFNETINLNRQNCTQHGGCQNWGGMLALQQHLCIVLRSRLEVRNSAFEFILYIRSLFSGSPGRRNVKFPNFGNRFSVSGNLYAQQ